MGKAPVRKPKQRPYKKGSEVYFLAFAKDKDKNVSHYMCRGEVVESPSQHTKAAHKVRITGVAASKLHPSGTEELGRTLLNKTIHLHASKLQNRLGGWLEPNSWWYL